MPEYKKHVLNNVAQSLMLQLLQQLAVVLHLTCFFCWLRWVTWAYNFILYLRPKGILQRRQLSDKILLTPYNFLLVS